MTWIVLGFGVLLALVYLGGGFRRADPAKLAANLRFAGGVGSIGVAIVLAATGRWAVAMPVGLFGLSLLGYGKKWTGIPGRRSSPPPGGRDKSTVATKILEVELDHRSGEMRGRVLAGAYAGRSLDELAMADARRLRAAIDPADRESLSLLDAYLDRREPGWREHVERDADPGEARPARPSAMSAQEAYETLGLRSGASEAEIRDAHRRLIKRVHPDAGGTTGLAAKINEAKERLLGGRRER